MIGILGPVLITFIIDNGIAVLDVSEALKQLEDVLDSTVRDAYFTYLTQWFRFHPGMTKDVFDEKIRNLFRNKEQLIHHNNFLLALLNKAYSSYRAKPPRQVNNKGQFELADYADYVSPSKRGASELFAPNSPFMSCRINIAAWRCGLTGADSRITQLMVFACQSFLKNLTTAIVTKARGYKVRDGKLQYSFNMPLQDPYTSISGRLNGEEKTFNNYQQVKWLHGNRPTLEETEIERLSINGISTLEKTSLIVNSKLVYETVRENPKILGQHGVHSVQSVKLSFLDDSESSSDDDSDY
ncbi:hypothetical protein YQE_09057, partial [Dendroctonus ponderosae]